MPTSTGHRYTKSRPRSSGGSAATTSPSRRPQEPRTRAATVRRSSFLCALLVLFVLGVLPGCTTYVRRDDLAQEYFNLGNDFYELEAYEQATEYYRKALALEPDLATANFNLARAYIETGVYGEAIAILEELRTEDEENVLVLETLAYAYSERRRYDEAIELYETVLDSSPYRVSALYSAGLLYRRREDLERAAELLERAWEAAPNDVDVLYEYGRVLHETEETEQAVAVLSEYVDAAPDEQTERLLEVAGIYSDARYYARAVSVYDGVLEREAENETALFEKAVLQLTVIEEPTAGLETLAAALEAGFSEEERIAAFLAREDVLSRTRVEGILDEYDLFITEEDLEEREGRQEGEEKTEADGDGEDGETDESEDDDSGAGGE